MITEKESTVLIKKYDSNTNNIITENVDIRLAYLNYLTRGINSILDREKYEKEPERIFSQKFH